MSDGGSKGGGGRGSVESRDHGSTHIRWVTCTSLVCLNDYQPTQTFMSLLSNLKISCLTWRVICTLEEGEGVREKGTSCADIRDPPQRRRRVSCIYTTNAECRNRSCVRHTETRFSRGTPQATKNEACAKKKNIRKDEEYFNLVKSLPLTQNWEDGISLYIFGGISTEKIIKTVGKCRALYFLTWKCWEVMKFIMVWRCFQMELELNQRLFVCSCNILATTP